MAILKVNRRNPTFMSLSDLVEEISKLGLVDALQEFHNKIEMQAKSIVAGPSFLQHLSKLFQIQISAGDIIQFESGNTSKYLYALGNCNMGLDNQTTIILNPFTIILLPFTLVVNSISYSRCSASSVSYSIT